MVLGSTSIHWTGQRSTYFKGLLTEVLDGSAIKMDAALLSEDGDHRVPTRHQESSTFYDPDPCLSVGRSEEAVERVSAPGAHRRLDVPRSRCPRGTREPSGAPDVGVLEIRHRRTPRKGGLKRVCLHKKEASASTTSYKD